MLLTIFGDWGSPKHIVVYVIVAIIVIGLGLWMVTRSRAKS